MKTQNLYRLADCTVIEPLANRWHAWSQLISPLTAGFHLLNYQCNVMKSYIDDPASHVQACRDPHLYGGPFIDIPIDQVGEVSKLLHDVRLRQGKNMDLAKAVIAFYNMLVNEATGQSIETFYERLPLELRGYVELVYDYYNRPTLRILESLLYESPYYDRSLQSLRLFRLETDKSRHFFMSTPRLEETNEINWSIPFADEKTDLLFRLERESHPLEYIRDVLTLDSIDETTFQRLFTQAPFAPRKQPDFSLLRVRYFGHATVLVEWNGIAILTDPCIPVAPYQQGVERFSYNDLPDRIDFVLITHNHHDHLVLESLLRLRHKICCLVVPKSHGLLYGDISLKLMARKLGFNNCLELDSLDSIDFPGGEIIGIPFLGEHSDIAHAKIGYVVNIGGERMLFASDSACLDDSVYKNIRKIIGPIHTVFLGMECIGAPLTWHCGSLLPKVPEYNHDQGRRSHGCDASGGLRILEILEARRFYNYAMGLEPWLEFLLGLGLFEESKQIKESNKLLQKARGRGFLAAERLYSKQDIYLANIKENRTWYRSLWKNNTNTSSQNLVVNAPLPIWFLSASEPKNCLCNATIIVKVNGEINKIALEYAISKAINKYNALKSRLSIVDKPYGLKATGHQDVKLSAIDLTRIVREQIAAISYSALLDEQSHPFDLEKGSLLRAGLINIPGGDCYLFLTGHRMLYDGQGLENLVSEVAITYAEIIEGRQPGSAQESLPTNERGGSEGTLDDLWGGGALDCGYLLESRPKISEIVSTEAVEDERYIVEAIPIAGHLLESLKRQYIKTESDLSIVLLAVFKAVIYFLGCDEDITVRAILESFSHSIPQGSIATLTSLVQMTTDLSGDPCFSALVERIRNVVAVAIEEQQVVCDADLDYLKLRLNVNCQPSQCHLFSVRRRLCGALRLPGSDWNHLGEMPPLKSSALMLWLDSDEAGISGWLSYNKHILNSRLWGTISYKYQLILQEVALNPNKHLSELHHLFENADYFCDVREADLNAQFNF